MSADGGLSWVEIEANSLNLPQSACQRHLAPFTRQLNAGSLVFSFTDRTSIDVSTDNGETWQQEWDFSFLTDERRKLYLERFDPTFVGTYSVGPFDAVFDEASQHLIVAMGHDGVLVRDNMGVWQWATVGDYFYRQEIFPDIESRLSILSDELILGFVLGFLTLTVITSQYLYISEGCNIIFVWGFWLFSHFLAAVFDEFLFGDFYFFLLIIVMAYCLFDLWQGFRLYYWRREAGLKIFGIAIACGVIVFALYMLPFLLWLQGTVSTYSFAWIFSLVLGNIGALFVGALFQSRYGEYFNKHPRKRIDPKTSLEDLFYPDDGDA